MLLLPEMPTAAPSLCLCAIVKNERADLPRCLASVRPQVDELLVVDTGSDDGTPELAAQAGARVEQFAWCDDFAAARNYALDCVRTDWVLVLDADEVLQVADENWRAVLASPAIAYYLPLTDTGNPNNLTPLLVPRLFRNQPELRYVGAYHEQLCYQGQTLPAERTGTLNQLQIVHYGYTPDRLQQKELQRNIPLLERLRDRQGLSFLLLYSLAGMYANTGQLEQAQGCYAEAGDRLLPHLLSGEPPVEFGYVPSLLFQLGVQALQEQDLETARLIAQRGLEWCADFPPLVYFAGATVRALGFRRGAIAYFQRCLELGDRGDFYRVEPFDRGTMTVAPAYDLGCLYWELQNPEAALAAFEQALAFDPNCAPARAAADSLRAARAPETVE